MPSGSKAARNRFMQSISSALNMFGTVQIKKWGSAALADMILMSDDNNAAGPTTGGSGLRRRPMRSVGASQAYRRVTASSARYARTASDSTSSSTA